MRESRRETTEGREAWTFGDVVLGLGVLGVVVALRAIEEGVGGGREGPGMGVMLLFWSAALTALALVAAAFCRRRGAWPLLERLTAGTIVREGVRVVPVLLVLGVVFGLIHFVFIHAFGYRGPEPPAAAGPPTSDLAYGAFLVMLMTLVPVSEEVYFRGFLYRALRTRFPLGLAAALQAAGFAIVHQYDLLQSVLIFLFGMALALVYEWRGTLWMPILLHVMRNATVALPPLVLMVLETPRLPLPV